MWYAIISEDEDNSLPGRKANREAHLARLREMNEAGRLLLAGPHPSIDADDPGEAGFSGSLLVLDFNSLEEAKSWADADPYVLNGIHKSVTVKPFKKVLP